MTSNTSAQEYYYFFPFFHRLLQNIIDFVSFAVPQLHCRQYGLIRLPDYSSSEWKENGERTLTVLRWLRSAAEREPFQKSITPLRHQQPERLHRGVCLWRSIRTDLIFRKNRSLMLAYYTKTGSGRANSVISVHNTFTISDRYCPDEPFPWKAFLRVTVNIDGLIFSVFS